MQSLVTTGVAERGLLEGVVTAGVPAAVEVLGQSVPKTTLAAVGGAVILFLLAVSGFFSSSEIAMFAFPDHRVETVVEAGRPGAETLKRLKQNPHRLLVTILVGNNLVNIAMSSIATGLLALFISQSQAVFLATLGITALVLLFGESAPKSYAVGNTESWALRTARPLKIAEYVLMPLVLLFDFLTRAVNRVTGGRAAIEEEYITRREIREIIETGEREGVLDEEERTMLQRTLRFNRTIAKEVMTPRLDMTAVSNEASMDEAIEECIRSGHNRVPVYKGSLDNVIGIVEIADLVRDRHYNSDSIALDDLIKPTLNVPESKNVDKLLGEMREQRLDMVIVIDEFGTTEGLVTIEDLVEEIVGEILEGGEEEPIEFVDDSTALVKGKVNIDIVNEQLGIDLPEGEEFETIAGFVFNRVGRLVDEDETIRYGDLEISVEEVEDTRITWARIAGFAAQERAETQK